MKKVLYFIKAEDKNDYNKVIEDIRKSSPREFSSIEFFASFESIEEYMFSDSFEGVYSIFIVNVPKSNIERNYKTTHRDVKAIVHIYKKQKM